MADDDDDNNNNETNGDVADDDFQSPPNDDGSNIEFEPEAKEDGDGAVAAPATEDADDDDEAIFAELKKKKKKKKPTAMEAPVDDGVAEPSAPSAEQEPEQIIVDLKKKKKKKLDMSKFEEELTEGQDDGGSEGKKTRKAFGSMEDDDEDDGTTTFEERKDDVEPWIGTDRDYTYDEMLGRAFRLILEANPEFGGEQKKFIIVPPQVIRDGAKKTVFVNINDISRRMRRSPAHVMSFLFTELGTNGSMDGSDRLIIKGRFQQKQIENVLRRYIVEYVTCKTCKSPDTQLVKEHRLTFVQCENCRSTRTVQAIKSGFSAQVGRRKKT